MESNFSSSFITITFIIFINCSHAGDLKSGEFVSEGYLQAVTNSRSPVKAAQTLRPQSIKVEKDKEGVTPKTIEDFNEGGPVFRLEKGKPLKTVTEGGSDPKFKGIDSTHFTFGYKGHPISKFRHIVDLNRFVSRIGLERNYIGTNQEQVEFTNQGEFVVNGSKKKFSIGLYYPPSFKRDYFDSDSMEFGFSRINDTLRLFEGDFERIMWPLKEYLQHLPASATNKIFVFAYKYLCVIYTADSSTHTFHNPLGLRVHYFKTEIG